MKAFHLPSSKMRVSVCRLCHSWCNSVLCQNCLTEHLLFQMRCGLCALPSETQICASCFLSPPLWTYCAAAVGYAEPWRELIIDFKFQSHPALGGFLAKVMRTDALASRLLGNADLLIPVPLSAERLRERGFNQSALLARQLCRHRVNDQLLWRVRHTAPQSGLDRQARLNNLWHSVAVNPLMQSVIPGRRLLLIDDVMTTGSTLSVCASALLSAGAAQVNCVVLARALPDSAPQSGFQT